MDKILESLALLSFFLGSTMTKRLTSLFIFHLSNSDYNYIKTLNLKMNKRCNE